MSYAALQAAWAASSASPGALPAGVAGTSLYGLSTEAKIAAVNGWTVTGSVPTTIYATGTDIANCIVWSELAALTDAQRKDVLAMLQIPGLLLGGSAQTAHLVPGMLVAYFPLQGGTIANLTALAKGAVQQWWVTAGLSGPITALDLANAGGLT